MSFSSRFERSYFRLNLFLHKRPRFFRTVKILSIIFLGFVIMNLINAILFTTILFLRENEIESDFDLDTRPFYRIIESKKRFDESGNYLIVQNFLQYQSNLTKNSDLLALNLHSNIEELHLLLQHVHVWDGPISLSLYIKGVRGSDDVDFASIWFRCHRKSFKTLNVHLIISAKAYAASISDQHFSHSVKYSVHCDQLTRIEHLDETDSTSYPSNLLRNVARLGMTFPRVQYVLTLDMKIFPSSDLFHHLVTFYTSTNEKENFNRTLYVIPTFEIHDETVRRSLPVPQNKRELLLLWNDQQIQPFEIDVCPSCQELTNYPAWKEETKSEGISPLFRPHFSSPWKPFYIGPVDVPLFDPRFKTHAHARISQSCESFLVGFDFAVLNNVYLYRLGFVSRSELIDDETSLLLFQQFLEDRSKSFRNSTRKC